VQHWQWHPTPIFEYQTTPLAVTQKLMNTEHPRQRKSLEDGVFMFEQPHLKWRRGIMARRFEEHGSAVLPGATATQQEAVVARQFLADLIAGNHHGIPTQAV